MYNILTDNQDKAKTIVMLILLKFYEPYKIYSIYLYIFFWLYLSMLLFHYICTIENEIRYISLKNICTSLYFATYLDLLDLLIQQQTLDNKGFVKFHCNVM